MLYEHLLLNRKTAAVLGVFHWSHIQQSVNKAVLFFIFKFCHTRLFSLCGIGGEKKSALLQNSWSVELMGFITTTNKNGNYQLLPGVDMQVSVCVSLRLGLETGVLY